MLKLIERLGRLLAKLYTVEARKLLNAAKTHSAAQKSAEALAAQTLSAAKRHAKLAEEATDKAASVYSKGQSIAKFFE